MARKAQLLLRLVAFITDDKLIDVSVAVAGNAGASTLATALGEQVALASISSVTFVRDSDHLLEASASYKESNSEKAFPC